MNRQTAKARLASHGRVDETNLSLGLFGATAALMQSPASDAGLCGAQPSRRKLVVRGESGATAMQPPRIED